MTKRMLIDAVHDQETRVVIADNDYIEDFDFITSGKTQVKGNIYLAKITRVEPSLQAAFVEYGGGKQGFLPFSEIHPDYYQIPVEDKQRLIEEEEAEARAVEEEEEREEEEKPRRRRSRRGRRGRGAKKAANEEANDEEALADADGNMKEEESSEDADGNLDDDKTDYQAARSKKDEVSSDKVVEADESDEEAEEETSEESGDAVKLESDIDVDAEAESSHDDDDEDDDADAEAETVQTDDVEETQKRRRKGASFKRYKIQEVIKRNQIVLVQVIKEERGNKGVSLTTYISLAGRYCVLMPNSPKAGGVSRKIGNGEQRKKLKEVVAELKESRGLSAIVRTAGIDRTKTEIKRDYEYLVKLWNQIREDTLESSAPALIYEESDIIKRSIRDMYASDVEQVFVQGDQAYKDAKAFMKLIMPSHAPRVKQYKDTKPIFAEYGVEAQLATMYEPNAKLPSGGSIVLQQTEALISIDVNSGRSTSERNVEETAIKTNLEAAREVARQLRLRDLAGLVVIDFIDMYYGKNRRTLERAMKEALKHDRAKIQMSRISPFGLMELSRQRLRPSIAESSTHVCPHCQGSGFIRSVESVAINIIRILEREAATGEYRRIKVQTYADVALHVLNDKREMIDRLEQDYDIEILFEIDPSMITGEQRILKTTEDGKELVHREEGKGSRRKPRRGRRGGRGRGRDDESSDNESDENESESEETATEEKEKKPRNRRGSRGGRGRRSKEKETDTSEDSSHDSSDNDDNGPDDDKPKRSRRRNTKKPDSAKGRSSTRRRSSKKDSADSEAASDNQEAPSAEVIEMEEPAAEKKKPSSRRRTTKKEPEAANDDSDTKADDSSSDEPKRKGWWSR